MNLPKYADCSAKIQQLNKLTMKQIQKFNVFKPLCSFVDCDCIKSGFVFLYIVINLLSQDGYCPIHLSVIREEKREKPEIIDLLHGNKADMDALTSDVSRLCCTTSVASVLDKGHLIDCDECCLLAYAYD